MRRYLSEGELRNRLTATGHQLEDRDRCPAPLLPPRRSLIGVGIGPDSFALVCRHYFVCQPWDSDDPPELAFDAGFALPPLFAEAAAHVPANGDFILGPVRWLVRRMQGWRGAWLWCDRRSDYFFDQFREEQDFPRLREWLLCHTPSESRIAAIHLDLCDALDVAVLWEKAKHVSVDIENYYLSDSEMHEVYYLHHHDQILCSVPDKLRWVQLVEELRTRPDLFEDWIEPSASTPD